MRGITIEILYNTVQGKSIFLFPISLFLLKDNLSKYKN